MANEEKRQERATMRPPDTAVRRVDLSRQREIENGEMRRDTEVERGASQPEERESVIVSGKNTSVACLDCLLIFENNLYRPTDYCCYGGARIQEVTQTVLWNIDVQSTIKKIASRGRRMTF